jgi:hypothetical protein
MHRHGVPEGDIMRSSMGWFGRFLALVNPRWDLAGELDASIVEGIGPTLARHGFQVVAKEGYEYPDSVSVQFFRGDLAISVGLSPRDGWSVLFVLACPGHFREAVANMAEGTVISLRELIQPGSFESESAVKTLRDGCLPYADEVVRKSAEVGLIVERFAGDCLESDKPWELLQALAGRAPVTNAPD